MSPSITISDIDTLVELAWTTLGGARRACGEHDDLTKDITSWHMTLANLKSEIANPGSVINTAKGGRRKDLEIHIRGCRRHLRRINRVFAKFNASQGGSGEPLNRIQFGTQGVKDISKSRLRVSTYTSAITMTLHLLSLGSQGKMEKELSRQREDGKGLRASINLLLAKRNIVSGEGLRYRSVASKAHDEKEFWRRLQRDLVAEGYKASLIHGHEDLLKAYVKELEARGVVDDKICRAQPPAKLSTGVDESASNSSHSGSEYSYSTVEDLDDPSVDEENHSDVVQTTSVPRNDQSNRQQPAFLQPNTRKVMHRQHHPAARESPVQVSATAPIILAPKAFRPPPAILGSERNSSPPRPKTRSPLSVLLFSQKHKSKRVATITPPPHESRKRHKREPPPPRPVSPTPPPPTWWLEERLRRRPSGYERGRSPPPPPSPPPPSPPPQPRYAHDLVYSRSVSAYPEVNHYGEARYGVV